MSSKYSKASYDRRMKHTPEERKERASLMAKAKWKKTTKADRIAHAKVMTKARLKAANKKK